MKANEFIKEHGLQYTKSIIEQFPKHTHVTNDGRMFIDENSCCNHIKRQLDGFVKMGELQSLIESHELVESYGGIDASNKTICDAFHGSNHPIPEGHEKLSLAIQDVESCQ